MTAWFTKPKRKAASAPVPVDAETVENTLKAFIATKSKLVAVSDIHKDTKVFSSGLLDSLIFIELVIFIEKEFKIKLSMKTEVNMNSIDSIGQMIHVVLNCVKSGGGGQNKGIK